LSADTSVTATFNLASGPNLPPNFPVVPTGNYNVAVQVCVAGTCANGAGFSMVNTDVNQFAQELLNALQTASANSCSQMSTAQCSFVISYTPWNGTSFTIVDTFTVTTPNGTQTITITYTVTRVVAV
jgi:hypothetical protein